MKDFPKRTLTLLFTDIEGSTRLLHRLGESYPQLLEAHREVLRAAGERFGGEEVDATGDATLWAFPAALDGVRAAAQMQREMVRFAWPAGEAPRVRIGLHTGTPTRTSNGYAGLDVHRGARVMGAAHGGQIVLSGATEFAVEAQLRPQSSWPDGLRARSLGRHRLRSFDESETIFQLEGAHLEREFPPLRALDLRPNNLPHPVTSLLGRAREVGELSSLLQRAQPRLISLIGAGGIGKTRLSIQVAHEVLGDFEDGVFFVSLASVAVPQGVEAALAGALGVTEAVGESLWTRLLAHLKNRCLLLVIDNFEHLLEAAPRVSELLAACPRLKVLATSRAPLNVRGEVEWALSPLELPALLTQTVTMENTDLTRIAGAASVELFVARALDVKGDFLLEPGNAGPVAQICTRLDGLPLAIELAAAQIKMMAPHLLLSRLEKRLDLLDRGPRDSPKRHRSLRGAIAWSYDLLGADSQRLFAVLGLFPGGWTLEIARDVAGLSLEAMENAFSSLLEHNLARVQTSGVDNQTRFEMLETIREFALEKLAESEEIDAFRARCTQVLAFFAEEMAPLLNGHSMGATLNRLDAELPNLRAALDWPQTAPDVGLRLSVALAPFFEMRSLFTEARQHFEAALERFEKKETSDNGKEENAALPIKALNALGKISFFQADFAAALTFLERAELLGRRDNDRSGLAGTLMTRGLVLSFWARSEDGLLYDVSGARAALDEALEIMRELGSEEGASYALNHLGIVATSNREFELAASLYSQSIEAARRAQSPMALGLSLLYMGEMLCPCQGRHQEAQPFLEESKAVALRINHQIGVAFAHWGLSYCALSRGDLEDALTLLRPIIPLLIKTGHGMGRPFTLEAFSNLAAARKNWRLAALLSGSAHQIRSAMRMPLPSAYFETYEFYLNQARALCTAPEWDAAWEEGRTLSFENACELV